MTCSSSTIFRPDEHAGTVARGSKARFALVLGTVLAGCGAFAVLSLVPSTPGHAGSFFGASSDDAGKAEAREDVAGLIETARKALARGDGIAAEMKLRAALDSGAQRSDVAAWMGEAYLAQNDPDRAREWLAPGEFSGSSAASGWRARARLARIDGELDAAAQAFDKALALSPGDGGLWIELARLRYVRGQHLAAIAAGEHALELAPENVLALQFKGQLVRDSRGLRAALPWFERARAQQPHFVPVLLDEAATLAELGRASEALARTREALAREPANPRAFYIQSVIAARAGDYALARKLLMRTRGALDGQPGTLLLQGLLDLVAGNPAAASEALETVLRARPDNQRARDLLAAAIYRSGEYRYLTLRFAEDVARDDASPYLLTRVARAYEALDERGKAGELLDRAARMRTASLRVVGATSRIGDLLAQGKPQVARSEAEAALARDAGFYDNLSLAGDAELAAGKPRIAQERYAHAAAIRYPESLFLRRYRAFSAAGDSEAAHALLGDYLGQNPQSHAALRLAASEAAGLGDIARARRILAWLRANGGGSDVRLLSELAVLEVGEGDAQAGRATARAAYRLQRSSPLATQALAYAQAARGGNPRMAAALLDKAGKMVGPTSLIERTRAMLGESEAGGA